MKRLIYILPLIFVLNVQSQIIISETTFPRPEAYTIDWQTHSSPTLLVPTQGTSQVWDYSVVPSNNTYTEIFQAVENQTFVGSDNCTDQATVDFEGLALTGVYYYDVNPNGYFQNGLTANEFKEFIGDALPAPYGGPNDSIIFEESDIIFSMPWMQTAFDSGYQDEWADTINWKANFTLTIEALDFDAIPGYYKQTSGIMSEVVGKGEITLPYESGTETFQALLIKTEEYRIDSFYLNDEPADAALVGLIGIDQGQDTRYYTLEFFIPNMNSSALIFYTNATYTDISYYRFNPDLPEPMVVEAQDNSLRTYVYPNPASDILYVETGELETPVKIFDVQGKLVYEGVPQNKSIDISSFCNGVYFVSTSNEKGKVTHRFVKQ